MKTTETNLNLNQPNNPQNDNGKAEPKNTPRKIPEQNSNCSSGKNSNSKEDSKNPNDSSKLMYTSIFIFYL